MQLLLLFCLLFFLSFFCCNENLKNSPFVLQISRYYFHRNICYVGSQKNQLQKKKISHSLLAYWLHYSLQVQSPPLICVWPSVVTGSWEKKKKIYFAFSTFSKFKFLKPNPVAKILLLRDLAVKIEKKRTNKVLS